MRFFGDTMSNYGVRSSKIIRQFDNINVECWELYRKNPVKYERQKSAYFNKESYKREFPKT
jgi:hypothetical protein